MKPTARGESTVNGSEGIDLNVEGQESLAKANEEARTEARAGEMSNLLVSKEAVESGLKELAGVTKAGGKSEAGSFENFLREHQTELGTLSGKNTLGISVEALLAKSGFGAEALRHIDEPNNQSGPGANFDRDKIITEVLNEYRRTKNPETLEGIDFADEIEQMMSQGHYDGGLIDRMLFTLPDGSLGDKAVEALGKAGHLGAFFEKNPQVFADGSLSIDAVQSLLDEGRGDLLVAHQEKIGEVSPYQFDAVVNQIPIEKRWAFLDKHDVGPDFRDANMNAGVLEEIKNSGVGKMERILAQEGIQLSPDVAKVMYQEASENEKPRIAKLIFENIDKFPELETWWQEILNSETEAGAEKRFERFTVLILSDRDIDRKAQAVKLRMMGGEKVRMESNLEVALRKAKEMAVKVAKKVLELAWRATKFVAKKIVQGAQAIASMFR